MDDKEKTIRSLTEEAADIFGGADHAQEWMETYSIPLGQTPRQFLENEGIEQFSRYLGQLKYGVCS